MTRTNIYETYVPRKLENYESPSISPSADKFELETYQHIHDVRLIGLSFLPYLSRSLDHHDVDKLDFVQEFSTDDDVLRLWRNKGFEQHRGEDPGWTLDKKYPASKHHKENVTCLPEVYEMLIDWIAASFRRSLMRGTDFSVDNVRKFINDFAKQTSDAVRNIDWEKVLVNTFNMALEFLPNFKGIASETGFLTLESEFDRLLDKTNDTSHSD